jgi:Ca-activated chloride channel family protein
MDSQLHYFHFLRPYWFIALIPVGLLLWQLMQRGDFYTPWEKICDKKLLPFLLMRNTEKLSRWPQCLAALAWLVTIIALAGPTWTRIPQAVYQNLTSTVIVLDMSNDMNVADIPPSRLIRAKYKIIDLLKKLNGTRVGLVAFTAEPFTVAPLTTDENTLEQLVPSLTTAIMPIAGSNIADALAQAGKLLSSFKGNIILLTASTVSPQDIEQATKLYHHNIMINVLGMGTEQGAPVKQPNGEFAVDPSGKVVLSHLDSEGLEKLAKAGGGVYVHFSDSNEDISSLLSFTEQRPTDAKLTKEKANIWYDQGRELIVLVMIVVLIAFRRGYLNEVLGE